MSSDASPSFKTLGLSPAILKAIKDVGYESPSPIQAQSIPVLLSGQDLLGQAQTGTGKTAAFALPLLSNMQPGTEKPQLLVLTPTRELAIQVAEAFQRYAHHLRDFHILPIYGGQPFRQQLRMLNRGVQVITGTPGRIMDHLRRGSLQLDEIKALVLDEADEMLRMGFIEDVKWILEHTPEQRQTALFSATMPAEIRKVAEQYLHDPAVVKIATRTTTAKTIHQRYWQVSGLHKLDALTRVLEAEPFDAMLVFVRTKLATTELAERLSARGYYSEPLNGDIPQKQREKTIGRLKAGKLDILVATDVAARGLDVERISHVVNYDIPYDTEAYVHRIGRTGRAGRKGEAILFVAPKERRLLKAIEKATGQSIEPMQMPSVSDINQQRVVRFKQRISDSMENQDLAPYRKLIESYLSEQGGEPLDVAAALASMAQGDQALLLSENRKTEKPAKQEQARKKQTIRTKAKPLKEYPELVMERYLLEVGHEHKVKPGNIVGAIANEADIESCYIGNIEIYDDCSTVDLPEGMPREVLNILRKARVCGRQMNLKRISK